MEMSQNRTPPHLVGLREVALLAEALHEQLGNNESLMRRVSAASPELRMTSPEFAAAQEVVALWMADVCELLQELNTAFHLDTVPFAAGPPTPPQALPLARHAAYVHESLSRKQYALMLEALEHSAQGMGYRFARDQPGIQLDEADKRKLGQAVMRAQLRFVAPDEPQQLVDRHLQRASTSGEPVQCADQLLDALSELGIVVAPRPFSA
jgi:hypothetical protein